MTSGKTDATFDLGCVRCERLSAFLTDVKVSHPDYHAAPVPPFGEKNSPLLIVGLAPGMHGANATGRPFTGDHAGVLLYETLYEHGLCNQPNGDRADDGLTLINCRITNAVKCLPPENKPLTAEINTCNPYLAADIACVRRPGVLVALGRIAHNAILRALNLKQSQFVFGHGAEHCLSHELTLIDSYHCSRYNTQTKRLTPTMFSTVFHNAKTAIARGR